MDLDVFEQWGRGAGTFLAQVDWLQMLAALLVVIAVRAALGKGLELVGHRMERVAQRSSNRYDDLIADMLSATRLAGHFDLHGERRVHFGLFASMSSNPASAASATIEATQGCC